MGTITSLGWEFLFGTATLEDKCIDDTIAIWCTVSKKSNVTISKEIKISKRAYMYQLVDKFQSHCTDVDLNNDYLIQLNLSSLPKTVEYFNTYNKSKKYHSIKISFCWFFSS